MKHTKGPWTVIPADENTTFYINPMNYELVVGGARSEGETFTEEEIANVNLMGKSTELLDRLEESVRKIKILRNSLSFVTPDPFLEETEKLVAELKGE